ncbi:NAD(P)-binding protein [Hypoxylon sp. FL1857]|nr:NAD(P)-binding protein [Hypoxylon sp. FL1857]
MATKLTLNGGIALVTGAASGIGKEVSFAFAEAGVKGVVFADINEQGAQEAAAECKGLATNAEFRAVVVKVDVTDEASVQNMVETAVKEFGRIDYSVNSAGVGNISNAVTPFVKATVFDKTMNINIKGTMLCVRAVSNVMANQEPLTHTSRHGTRSLGRGSIVNLGSINSYIGAPAMLAYTTSKHAVIGLTKSAAIDGAKIQVRVNAVCPSWADTPMLQAGLQKVPQLEQMIKAISPARRAAVTEEVADYVLFLCSPSATYINGTGLRIDAGITVTAHAM